MEDRESYLQRIGELVDRAAYRQALKVCEQALVSHPDCAEAHEYQGLILCRMGRYREALPAYDRAISIEPDFVPALLDKAELLVYYLGENESAVALSDRVLRLCSVDGDRAHALFLKGIAYANLDQHEEALANYEQSIALDPDYPDSHCESGVSLYECYRFSAALQSLKRAATLDAGYARPHHFLGCIYEFMGEETLADREYVLAARLDQDAYPSPLRLTETDFRAALEEAIHTLSREAAANLPTVAIDVKTLPDRTTLADGTMRPSGVAHRGRTPASGATPLVLYQRNFERAVRSRTELVEEIAHALSHELGHPACEG
jgi:tetratricopeptide (TPR) repeat protein